MKLSLTVFSAMVLVGCDGYQPPPTNPDPPPSPPSLTAMALDGASVNCVGGTTIELIKAQTVVESGRHDANCGPWDGGGVTFYKVAYGEVVTLRASAAGYETQEMTVVAKENTRTQQGLVFFELRRTAPDSRTGNASLSAVVVDSSGLCIVGAVVEVVQGQRTGTRIDQDPNCDVSRASNVVFDKLVPGEHMVLRASAPGYRSKLNSVQLHYQQAFAIFRLEPTK